MQRIWVIGLFGPLIMLLGAYVAGGTDVVCARVGAPAEALAGAAPVAVVGSCRVQTRRWLGRKIVAERTYLRVTGVDRIAEWRTETSTDSKGRSSSRRVAYWSLQLMSNGVEIDRIGAPRDKVDPAYDKATAWFDGNAGSPLTLDFSEWRFAYAAIGFGTVWFGGLTMISRANNSTPRRGRRARRMQQQT
jgi:hypothetical protein